MIDLIRKRHPGDAWIVFQELANGTGGNVRGFADAVALGVWPSTKYELHGYEMKNTREDTKREIKDPTKADTIGRYCHFWWLVLADEKLMEGLVIPQVWGILVPRGKILRVIRKAPLVAKPKPFDAGFCAAMIRNATKTWVPRDEHERLRDATLATARAEAEAEISRNATDEDRALRGLRDKVVRFKTESGIDLAETTLFEIGDVGRAVKTLVHARRLAGHQPSLPDLLRGEAERVADYAQRHRKAAAVAANAAGQIEELAGRLEADENAAIDAAPQGATDG